MKSILILLIFLLSINAQAQYEDSFTNTCVIEHFTVNSVLNNIFIKDSRIVGNSDALSAIVTDSTGKTIKTYKFNYKGKITEYTCIYDTNSFKQREFYRKDFTGGDDFNHRLLIGKDVYKIRYYNDNTFSEIDIKNEGRGLDDNFDFISRTSEDKVISHDMFEKYAVHFITNNNNEKIISNIYVISIETDYIGFAQFKPLYDTKGNLLKVCTYYLEKKDTIFATLDSIARSGDTISFYPTLFTYKKFIAKNNRLTSKIIRYVINNCTADVKTEFFYRKNGLIDYTIQTIERCGEPFSRNKFIYKYDSD